MAIGFIRNLVGDFWDIATSPDGRGTPPPPPRVNNHARPSRTQNMQTQIIQQPRTKIWTPPMTDNINQLLDQIEKNTNTLRAQTNTTASRTTPQPLHDVEHLLKNLKAETKRLQEALEVTLGYHGTKKEAALDIFYNNKMLMGTDDAFWIAKTFGAAKNYAIQRGGSNGLIIELHISDKKKLQKYKDYWKAVIHNPKPETYYRFTYLEPWALYDQHQNIIDTKNNKNH